MIVVAEADARSPEAAQCLRRYYEELRERFEEGFDVERSVSSGPDDFVPPRGAFLLVLDDERPVGCGGVTLSSLSVGDSKMMWIDPDSRGRGLGRRLLHALEDTARDLGCTTARLETNRVLTGAIRMYRTSGYQEVEPFNDEFYAHHWFEKALGGSNNG